MNVLFLANDLAYGGPARQVVLLAAGLPRDRFTARAFTLRADAPWSRALRETGVPVEAGDRHRLFDARPFLALRKAVREFRPDVIHAFGLVALRALAATPGRGGARVILSAAAPAERATRLSRLDRWLIGSWVDRLTARGPAEAERYRRLGVYPEKIAEVPPGVPPAAPPQVPHPEWCRSLGLPENARLLVGVGPLEPAKGFRDAIWAFDILQFLYDDVHLLLVGAGPEEPRLRDFARVTRSTGRVHFLGERADLGEVLGHAELVWVPSRADRGAGAALEALAAGRPVVASRWPGLAEVVADGETGVLVAPGDKAALARETRLLLDDPGRRRRLGEAARRRAAERFAAAAMVRGFEQLYAAVTAGKVGGG
jgi:glycosyltransferase involved in cell wall biosynthesis